MLICNIFFFFILWIQSTQASLNAKLQLAQDIDPHAHLQQMLHGRFINRRTLDRFLCVTVDTVAHLSTVDKIEKISCIREG